ncbi:MAG TPA: class I SAM-dependent methyltransferase [Candidatus Acidoferrum sp.]|nr:class I SAM-dependent methyltransferase [Candidatus Acidoferrum sp.]
METAPPLYYDHVRTEVLNLFTSAPQRLLDVGCGSGATSAAAKARWPALETIGVEVVAEAAERAREVLDSVVEASAESLDFAASGIADVDAVILADVLEHMVDPWAFLTRLRGVLRADAIVVASIPNVANLWLLEELAVGRFTYESSGLLDATHLRFFTRASIGQMFERAGYRIERWERLIDGRVDRLTQRYFLGKPLPRRLSRVAGVVAGHRVVVRRTSEELYHDLRTIQFLVVARPERARPSAS